MKRVLYLFGMTASTYKEQRSEREKKSNNEASIEQFVERSTLSRNK
jgi:hypothetical protein